METNQLPDDVSAAIQECWPDAVVAEFDPAESYFHDIHAALERDLRKIPGALLLWQSQPDDAEWQSYHVFFLACDGSEFETTSSEEKVDAPVPGRGWNGCAVCVSLASPIAALNPEEYCQFEDNSETEPDIVSQAYDQDTGEPVDIWQFYRDSLGEETFARIDEISVKIAAVLDKHELWLLGTDILDLPVPELAVDEAIALEPPLVVRDAFFFRGA